jgi:hypothetical protein
MTKLMGLECIQEQEESPVTKESGEMTNNMVKGGKYGKTAVNILEHMLTPRKKEWVCISGQMETGTWVGGKTTRSMETWASINGKMGELIVVVGRAI